jgi:ribosomal protein S18 acetylase RimI-like enzyme
MTAGDGLTIRPITGPAELGLFNQLPDLLNGQLADDLRKGNRQPGWMWVATRGGRLVARAAWWGRRGRDVPHLLDIVDLDDADPAASIDDTVRLLAAAMAAVVPPGTRPPEYLRALRPDWRDRRSARQPAEDRMTAVERAGGRVLVERLRLEWRRGTPVPAPSGRLAFRPVRDERELITLMTGVLAGTLDAHARDDLTRMSPQQAATLHYQEELGLYASPRDWWRVAALPGGAPAGFVIPAHNGYSPIIAYIGVLPALRGRGYVGEILAEGTRILADRDVSWIRASTDLGNVPMARAFHRAGWVTYEHEIDMTWPG